MTKRFYKENGTWFIDLKLWPADKCHLAMVLGADKLLDVLSKGANDVKIRFSSKDFENYDGKLVLKNKLPGKFSGAVYDVKNVKIDYSFSGDNKDSLWLCGVTLFVFLRYPKNIYFQVVNK